MTRIPIRNTNIKNMPRILDYVKTENGEEHIEYKVNHIVKSIKLSDLENQIRTARTKSNI